MRPPPEDRDHATCLVTGVAGFIGSHLAESLVKDGHFVKGLDSFTDFYPRRIKLSNLSGLRKSRNFTLVEGDINTVNLSNLLRNVEYVFHLAAQPGVRPSWGSRFRRYLDDNVLATQTLLEACREKDISKFVYASSSSIYGEAEHHPTSEETPPRPLSPYGATKLLGENLCSLYRSNFGVPTVILRYFTVYGPRQRPDMAFHRFIAAASRGGEIVVYGDGLQKRDFTYVSDVIAASRMAVGARAGTVYNVGSGSPEKLLNVVKVIVSSVGQVTKVRIAAAVKGDVTSTSADNSAIRKELNWKPTVSLKEGIERQVEWQTRRNTGEV